MRYIEGYTNARFSELKSYVDSRLSEPGKKVNDLNVHVDGMFKSLVNRINDVKADTDYLKRSIDYYRYNNPFKNSINPRGNMLKTQASCVGDVINIWIRHVIG